MIVAAIGLMIALQVYFSGQKPEVDVVYWVCGVGFFGIGGVFFLYITLIFKKIMLFDDRIEIYCLNKVIVRTYSQIKSCYVYEGGGWPTTRSLILECEPDFMYAHLKNTLLHKNDLYKIEEILNKKGVKDDDWI
ncbi:MAG: hypothetical protein SOZ73_07550 [Campylobacter sp.]|nr:hypothetical protein [Campylobacter sp.]